MIVVYLQQFEKRCRDKNKNLKYFIFYIGKAQRLSKVGVGGGRGMRFQTGIKSIPGDTRSHPAGSRSMRSRKVLRLNKKRTAKYEKKKYEEERLGKDIH